MTYKLLLLRLSDKYQLPDCLFKIFANYFMERISQINIDHSLLKFLEILASVQ